MLKFALILAAFLVATLANPHHLSCDEYEKAYLTIDDWLSKNIDFIPSLVRLSFHDCVGKACDGCINFEFIGNAGLGDVTYALDEIYEKDFDKIFTRADFWQLASQIAIVRAGLNRHCDKEHCTFLDLQYVYGRKDCKTSPTHKGEDDGGSPHGDFHEVWRVLHGYFGMDEKEIVAILGAHSLGGAHKENSGFDYNWQRDHIVFDNQYFKNLLSLPWTHEDQSQDVGEGEEVDPDAPPRWQFAYIPEDEEIHPILALNTDMSLWKKVIGVKKEHEFTGRLKCDVKHHLRLIPEEKEDFVSSCPDAKTSKYVYEFAHHLEHFYTTFSAAWWKMVTNGYKHLKAPGHLKDKCGHCIPEGGFCVAGFEKSGQCCGGDCVHNKCVKK